ncbi:MAG: neutral zinc metallopeptidase [Cyclobacteriaceae bacterium]
MKWRGRTGSRNVVDGRRGSGGRLPGGGKTKFGIGTVVIVIIIALITGQNPLNFINMSDVTGGSTSYVEQTNTNYQGSAEDEELKQFISVVLKETEDYWNTAFPAKFNRTYQEPKLFIYNGLVTSRCGRASAATGPFYCPGDQTIYIDLSFYRDLKNRFKAPGDFAMAYVVAHEVGHHVQYLLGITKKVDSQRGRVAKADYNELSVRLELQADFLAGVWAHYADRTKNILEDGDIEEALNAANAIGDDRLQKQAQGYVVPESFTHGTSAQRMRWFKKGYQTGNLDEGDTFATNNL